MTTDGGMKMTEELRVWGVGNVLLGDDAAGCRVVELLSVAGMEGAIDCGTTPENYIATLRKNSPCTLLIVDAAEMGLLPGECRLMSLSEMEAVADTSHGIPLSMLLEPFRREMEIVALGIQPESLQLGAPLSALVNNATHCVAEMILRNEWRSSIKNLVQFPDQREGR